MGALHVNGQKATGVNITFADGMFIDADNVIFTDNINEGTIVETTYSYTATEDCYVYMGGMTGSSADATADFYIDGQKVGQIAHIDYKSFSINYYLKKGQTLQASNLGYWYYIKVYGIQQGTIEGKLQPVIYSTEEREVGVWTDGKPLYQRTLQGTVSVTSTSRNWYTLMPVSALPNLDNVVPIDGSYIIDSGDGQVYPIPMTTGISQGASTSCVYNTSEGLRVCLEGVSAGTSNYSITLQYTKTTDTAGAGTWTPDGAYAHHYSTEEKVVGTWIDGSTIYGITTDMGTAGVSIPAGASKDSNIPIGNIENITYSQAISQSGKYFPVIGAELGGSYVQMINMGGSNRNVRWFTIQYTKSS